MTSTRALTCVLALAWTAALACGSSTAQDPTPVPAPPAPTYASALPSKATEFAPSQMRVVAKDGTTRLDEVESCAGCHADVAAQWRTSSHAFASFDNPIYRASVLRFRDVKGKDTSKFCGGCHDISLMAEGAMTSDIEPTDSRAHAGITCRTCHGIESVRADGDASYDLRITPIEVPKDGDPDSVKRHKVAVALKPLRTSALCTTCHRVYLDESTGNAHHLPGQDEGTAWMRSAYAGSLGERLDAEVPESTCQACHMAKEPATRNDAAAKNGRVSSHRFLGSHTWLAAMRKDDEQLARVKDFLRGVVSIDIAALRRDGGARELLPDGAAVTPGEHVVLDVVVRNLAVGHRFPGGVLDAEDTWLELVATDAKGRVVAQAGTQYGKTGKDPTAHVLRGVLLDDAGQPVVQRETDRFRVTVTNHTVPARDAEMAEYAMNIPDTAALPLKIVATVRLRTRSLPVQALACADVKTPRGTAFAEAQKRLEGQASLLDPCTLQPITDVADTTLVLGGASPRDPARDFQRAFDYALGLSHVLQERLDEGREPLDFARAAAHTARERAMAKALLAWLEARQGRPDDALLLADDADHDAPGHPFLSRVRGEALAQVWRFDRAAPWLQTSAEATPLDDSAWSRLAVVLGSANRPKDALVASLRALALAPRDADALRVQALSLDALNAPKTQIDAAKDAFLERRTPDDGPGIKGKCSAKVPGCALERDPVHVHQMR